MADGAVGILGGTFDPVHHGHLRLAIEIGEGLGLAEVRLLPAAQPNLRDQPGATAEQRRQMLEIALAGTPLVLDARELAREGMSYTVDTLAELRAEVGPRPLCFILGQDAFNGLPRWHRWQRLLDYAHLVVATRPGYTPPTDPVLTALLEDTRAPAGDALLQQPAGRILLFPIPRLPIAATDLRERVRAGRSLVGLTPAGVVDYIARHRLYQHPG